MVFAIMYEIDPTNKDYSALYEKIKTLGSWMHYFSSVWFLLPSEKKTARQIYDDIVPFIDGAKDYLLVIEITGNYRGWLPQKAWDWMHDKGL